MKIITFQLPDEEPVMGFLTGQRIFRPSEVSSESAFRTTQAFIEGGANCWKEAGELLEKFGSRAIEKSDSIRLLAPLPVPPQMRDFMCFEGHVAQSMESISRLQAITAGADPQAAAEEARREGRCKPPQAWYDQPLYYKANRFAVSGPDAEIVWPSYSSIMDYECELACIIGEGGKDISADDAKSHIFGFTIWNDFSARDAQFAEIPGFLGPAKGKDFDGANAMGPCIVTIDEIGDYYDLQMSVSINGKTVSSSNSGSIHHSFERMIERVSECETLHPGEVIGSGTVTGGCGLERMQFLEDGDTIELEIERIGTLRNTVRRA